MLEKLSLRLVSLALVLASSTVLSAQTNHHTDQGALPQDAVERLRDLLAKQAAQSPTNGLFTSLFRTIDGTGNNTAHPNWGATHSAFLRLTSVGYENGADSPRFVSTSAREASNLCVAQPGSILNAAGASDFLWQWGQFIDHDLDEAPGASPAEPFNVDVPVGDPFFDPASTGIQQIPLNRSSYLDVAGVRQQINALTAFIDGSMVYGSDAVRANALRTLDGSGRLKTSAGNLLPYNTPGLPNAPNSDPSFFLAGDVRVNEQIGLTAMHTLFVREHNFWADALSSLGLGLSDEDIYQGARAIVGAEIQAITYREFLPLLLGPNALPAYKGYRANVNPGISNEFATAAYRVGHTLLSPELKRLDAAGQVIAQGNVSLADAFFRPDHVTEAGIDPILRGLAAQEAQEIDTYIVDPVRNFLFGPPGAGGFDLASLNIQRGRDHGLPSYNQARVDLGLPAVTSFAQITPDAQVQANLAAAYTSVDDIDLWVGGLAEPHVNGGLVGATFRAILRDQFRRLRDGDRFYYKHYLPQPVAFLIDLQSLSTIIRRNTGIGGELQNDAFRTP